ncbi:MAG: Rrf2 family transcriptional regulator [Spirochaetia bacterium]
MLRITRSVEYGLIAVNYLASLHGELARARDLSERLKLPSGIVAKVLQRLAAAGIVVSEQGAHGGYRLGRSLDELSFLQLSEAIEGPQHVTPCSDVSACDRMPYCTVTGPVADLGTQITDLLSGISVGALLRGKSLDHREGAVV